MAFKPIGDLPLGKVLQPFQQKGVHKQLATLKLSKLEELKAKKQAKGQTT